MWLLFSLKNDLLMYTNDGFPSFSHYFPSQVSSAHKRETLFCCLKSNFSSLSDGLCLNVCAVCFENVYRYIYYINVYIFIYSSNCSYLWMNVTNICEKKVLKLFRSFVSCTEIR